MGCEDSGRGNLKEFQVSSAAARGHGWEGITVNSHSLRVCLLSMLTGMALKMPESDIWNLAEAAWLHDIGKWAVAPEILDKPTGLEGEEVEEVQRHVEYGYHMLMRMDNLSPIVREAVYEHHENMDGTGYPRGLAGEEISLYARIIHIVDVYDALTSKRCYKDAMSSAEAVAYLQSEENKMFDGAILQIFLEKVVGSFAENDCEK